MKLTRAALHELAVERQRLSTEIDDLRRTTSNLTRQRDTIDAKLEAELTELADDRATITTGTARAGFLIAWTFKNGSVKYKEELLKRISADELAEIQASVAPVRKLEVKPR